MIIKVSKATQRVERITKESKVGETAIIKARVSSVKYLTPVVDDTQSHYFVIETECGEVIFNEYHLCIPDQMVRLLAFELGITNNRP